MKLSPTHRFPWDENQIGSEDAGDRVDYFKSLLKSLRAMYAGIVNVININAPVSGDWTPAITFGGVAVGVVYGATNGGYYTRVGDLVTVTGALVLTSKGVSVGNAVLGGLPFTVVNNSAAYACPSLRFDAISFANQHQACTLLNTTTIYLGEITEAGVITPLTNVNFANNSTIMIGCTYRAIIA